MPAEDNMSSELHGDVPSASSSKGFSDRKELAAFAFERTRMPMVVADASEYDQPIVLANRAFLELTGYTAEEVIGRNCRLLQGQGTSPTDVAAIRWLFLKSAKPQSSYSTIARTVPLSGTGFISVRFMRMTERWRISSAPRSTSPNRGKLRRLKLPNAGC